MLRRMPEKTGRTLPGMYRIRRVRPGVGGIRQVQGTRLHPGAQRAVLRDLYGIPVLEAPGAYFLESGHNRKDGNAEG